MADQRISTNIIKFTVKAEDSVEEKKFTVTFKNPLPIEQSDTMILKIGNINSSLSGSLSNLWLADETVGTDKFVTEIIKAELFEQTKTISEDGKTITTFSKSQTFYESP